MPCGTDQRACNLPAATPPQYQVLKRREHFKLLSNIISNFRSIKASGKWRQKICNNDYRFFGYLDFSYLDFPTVLCIFIFISVFCPVLVLSKPRHTTATSTRLRFVI